MKVDEMKATLLRAMDASEEVLTAEEVADLHNAQENLFSKLHAMQEKVKKQMGGDPTKISHAVVHLLADHGFEKTRKFVEELSNQDCSEANILHL